MYVSINIKVRPTSEVFMGDVKVHRQRDRARRIREVARQLDVPTSLTPVPSHLLHFHLCGLCERGQQFDQPPSREPSWHPSGWYTCRGGHQEHLSETSCNHKPREAFPQGAVTSGIWASTEVVKKVCQRLADQDSSLRQGLISTIRPDLSQPTHRLEA
jgi:hypothetical protein